MANAKAAKGYIDVIEGTVVYAKVNVPDTKYQSTEKEWSIEVITDEDTAEAWDEKFQKQKSKKIKAADFEAKYRIPCPIAGVKNVYSIKLKRAATKDGVEVDEKFKPKVYIDDANGERTEVGASRLIANGSFGKVSFYVSSNDFGTFARLQNCLFQEDKFIEYQSNASGSGASGNEFGSKPVKVEAPRESANQPRPVKPVKKAVEEDDEVSLDAPF